MQIRFDIAYGFIAIQLELTSGHKSSNTGVMINKGSSCYGQEVL